MKGFVGVFFNFDFMSDVIGDYVVFVRYVFGGNYVKKD